MKAALLAVSFAVLTSACVVGGDGGTGGDDDDVPPPTGITGSITGDQTWSGAQTIVGETTIEAGVTVTVTPGAAIEVMDGLTLRVKGTLNVEGTAAGKVTFLPVAGALTWAGIVADDGADVSLAYVEGTDVATLVYCHAGATCALDHVVFDGIGKGLVTEGVATISRSRISDVQNGGITVTGAGDLTITDSYLLTSSGDIVVQTGGSLVIEHSEIGETTGSYEHCDLHVGAAANLRITRTNIRSGVYGMMLGGTDGAVMQYNNWVENGAGNDISEVGVNTAVDARFNYWDQGAPSLGAAYDVSSPSATRIADAGPRPE
jgi:hypothetical protein